VTISSINHALVLRAAMNLFASTEPSRKLEATLKAQGIDYRAIVERTGPICLRRITVEDDTGTFEIDAELGEPAFILAVHAVDAETVIDLVGWPIYQPEAWSTYFGFAGLLGGDAAVNPASFIEEPCPIWASPLAWLQGGLRGCVVLEPRLAATILRQAHGLFQCEGREHAKWLVEGGAVAATNLKIPSVRAAA
jgi:hypothetical protein